MKTSIVLLTLLLSVNAFSQTAATVSAVTVANAAKKNKNKKAAAAVKPKADVPCDTKEDVLKKLEEQKKAASEDKTKGFSLQGGNTGCSVK